MAMSLCNTSHKKGCLSTKSKGKGKAKARDYNDGSEVEKMMHNSDAVTEKKKFHTLPYISTAARYLKCLVTLPKMINA